MAREGMARRCYGVLGLVVLGHVLIVVLLLRQGALTEVRPKEKALSQLLLELSTPARRTTAGLPARVEKKTQETKKWPGAPDRIKAHSGRSVDSAVSYSDPPPSQSGSDWYHQAEEVANIQAESIFEALKHACDEYALHGDRHPECRKYKKPDAWVPEPKKVGIAGGLPYVRLGKRCVIGLGFFGCGVGKLPEANGHALDDMRDPDKPSSSVPDPNE